MTPVVKNRCMEVSFTLLGVFSKTDLGKYTSLEEKIFTLGITLNF